MNIGKVEELLSPGQFIRLNRSAIVRIEAISTVNRKNHQCTITYAAKEITFRIPAGKLREISELLGG
jgi:DNA-binding LytR/AlgR family response regulator